MGKGYTHDGLKIVTNVELNSEQDKKFTALNKFLSKTRSVTAFSKNCVPPSHLQIKSGLQCVRQLVKDNEEFSLIFHEAFVWDETEEGFIFWDNLDADWQELCELKGIS